MKYLSGSKVSFENISDSEDTQRLNFYLNFIDKCLISGIPMILDTKDSETLMRFLSSYLAISEGKWLITGSKKIQNRPITELVDSINSLGANINYAEKTGFPPLIIKGGKIKGGRIEINPSQSSKFVCALMMIAPYFKNGLEISMLKNPVSDSLIKMTAELMRQFKVNVETDSEKIIIPKGDYKILNYNIEADWSSVSYWHEVVALSNNSEIFISNLSKNSLQGDSVVADIFSNLGVETIYNQEGITLKSKTNFKSEFEYDFKNYPDLLPAVMATCAAKGIKLTVKGIGHLKYKELDRILNLEEELSKIGGVITKEGKSYILTSDNIVEKVEFNTHDDHRIAMCLAPLVLVINEVIINDTDVVKKSYPNFWKDMKKLNVFK